MKRVLALLGCRDMPDFLAMCGCYLLLASACALLLLPVVLSPMWWHA